MSTNLTAEDFTAFFEALHGREPFPWQRMLAEQVARDDRWPDLIDLPTASGKTACIDVAIFNLALQADRTAEALTAARRVWFVVDRRIIVDEAYERSAMIAFKLRSAREGVLQRVADRLRTISGTTPAVPLQVGRLRGGLPRDLAWNRNPAQPAVLTSTVDQIGSRLLFRGYGVGDRQLPMHAALTGNDSLILLDEAHLAKPFRQTIAAVKSFRSGAYAPEPVTTPFDLVVMSATVPPTRPGETPVVAFPSTAERPAALDHPVLQQRRAASKPTTLLIAKPPKDTKSKRAVGEARSADALVSHAARCAADFVDEGRRRRVAVMVNRVRTAREIAQQLRQMFTAADGTAEADIVLLTGRLRPVDRDDLIERYQSRLKAGSKEPIDLPIILVTTQCLEVGADFSFDALVTECASLDALRQRFGRLDRLGDIEARPTPGVVLARDADVKAQEKLDDDKPRDPIYGNALARTWQWLTTTFESTADFGIDAFAPYADTLVAGGTLAELLAPTRTAPTLLPAYLDLWSQTNPKPAVEAEVALFLHGVPPPDERSKAEVRVLWRNELCWANADSGALLEAVRPVSGEMLNVSRRDFLDALGDASVDDNEETDVEGQFEAVPRDERSREAQQDVRDIWVYRDRTWSMLEARQVRHGDVIALEADFTADSPFKRLLPGVRLPQDVFERAAGVALGAPVVRFPAAFGTRRLEIPELEADERPTAEQLLAAIATHAPTNDTWWQHTIEALRDGKPRVTAYAPDAYFFSAAKPTDKSMDWDFAPDEDDEENSRVGNADERTLERHTQRVIADAVALAKRVAPAWVEIFRRAATLHDLGKGDERFQSVLAGRRVFTNDRGTGLLAKSGLTPTCEQARKLNDLFKLPKGFRHELLSTQMLDHQTCDALTLHLIASHHGHARPFAPVIADEDPSDVAVTIGGIVYRVAADDRRATPPHVLDSGIAERFWTLTRRHGWWGLAYLETVLRCADQHASAAGAREQKWQK